MPSLPPRKVLLVDPDGERGARLEARLQASGRAEAVRVRTVDAAVELLDGPEPFEAAVLAVRALTAPGLRLVRMLHELDAPVPVVAVDGGTAVLIPAPRHRVGVEPSYGDDESAASAILDLLEEADLFHALDPAAAPTLEVEHFAPAPDIVFRIDAEGRYLEVTTGRPELLLAPAEEIVGSTLEEVLPPRVAAVVRETLLEVLESGRTGLLDFQLPLQEPRHFETRVVPVDAGEVLAVVRDVTEARRARREFERREQFLRLINSQVPAVLWTTDLELRFTSSSGSGLEALGLEEGEAVGVPFHDFFETADPEFPPILAHLRALAGESASLELEWKGVDFTCHVEPLQDPEGEIIGTIGVALDVTARNRVHRRLEEREALLRQAQELERMGSWVWDLETDRLELSEPLLMLCGRAPDEFDGRPETLVGWIAPADREAAAERIRKIREDGEPRGGFFRVVRPDGVELIMENEAIAIDGSSRLMGTVRDVTERVLHEEVLRRSRRELRNLADRLHLAREWERRAVAREVHDVFGQALTSARLDTVWLQKHVQGDDPELRRRLDVLRETVEQLLDTARDLTVRLRPPVLDELGLEAAVEWQVVQVERRSGLAFTTRLPPIPLELDEVRATALFRILQEALTNVVRHAEARNVEVALRKDGDRVVLSVEDDGSGISGEALASSESIGLIGMAERARVLGGSTRIERGARGGTRVVASLPLPEAEG